MWGDEVAARLAKQPELAEMTLNWLITVSQSATSDGLMATATRQLQRWLATRRLVVLHVQGDQWHEVERIGGPGAVPSRVVTETLDMETASHVGDWSAAPLHPRHV